MDEQKFEQWLFAACDGFFGDSTWHDPVLGLAFYQIIDAFALHCTDEQWMIVDETLQLLADPDHITGEVSLDTPVSSNDIEEWQYE